MMEKKITTIILTYNEELNIQKCIDSVKDISRKIIIIDSFSTDKTEEIAKSNNVELIKRKFKNHSDQFQYALNNCEISTPWILRLDADEHLTQKGILELHTLCEEYENDKIINGIILKFSVHFLGKELKFGGVSPIKNLRVFKKGLGGIENRVMDEHIYLYEGKAIEMKNVTTHNDQKSLHNWIDKHNKYATLEAREYFENKKEKNETRKDHLVINAKIKRFFKNKVYYKLPLFLRSTLYFFYRYIIKLAFLDGKEGLIFTFLQAYWYRVLVDAKILEEYKKEEINENYNI